MIRLVIIAFLIIINLMVIKDKSMQRKICGLCAEHNEFAKREYRGCAIYGCIYDMNF